MPGRFRYPITAHSGSLKFSSMADREFPMPVLALPNIEIKRTARRRKARLYAGESYRQLVEEEQRTELIEKILYAALGASGLAGVVVSFL